MFGFAFGTLCMVGLIGLAKAGRHRHHGGHGRGRCGGPRGGMRGRRRGQGMGRAFGEVLKRRLDVDDDQELVVDHALRDAREAMREWREGVRDDREAFADAFRDEDVDQAAIDAVFARQDEAMARARRQVLSAMKQVHAVLDAEQRQQAADDVASLTPGWR